jgi:hypothetical protein
MSITRVEFQVDTPKRTKFEVLRVNEPSFGVVYNVRYKKRVFNGKTVGQAIGKMFDSINWGNVLAKD